MDDDGWVQCFLVNRSGLIGGGGRELWEGSCGGNERIRSGVLYVKGGVEGGVVEIGGEGGEGVVCVGGGGGADELVLVHQWVQ